MNPTDAIDCCPKLSLRNVNIAVLVAHSPSHTHAHTPDGSELRRHSDGKETHATRRALRGGAAWEAELQHVSQQIGQGIEMQRLLPFEGFRGVAARSVLLVHKDDVRDLGLGHKEFAVQLPKRQRLLWGVRDRGGTSGERGCTTLHLDWFK